MAISSPFLAFVAGVLSILSPCVLPILPIVLGTATLIPSQPNLLCVPSWKSLTGPPGKTPKTPPRLNHFTCYPVKLAPGSNPYNPPPVMLQDEFAPAPVNAQVAPVPADLCLPTEKILPNGKVFKIINPALHLLCFPVSPTPVPASPPGST